MIRQLVLENFKAFGTRVTVPLAPITLLFGENSAGKSSILHALSLLKQSRDNREMQALLLPRVENGLVDLGSFPEMLFDHDLGRKMRIGMVVDGVSDSRSTTQRSPAPKVPFGIEWTFSRTGAKSETSLESLSLIGDRPDTTLAEFVVEDLKQGRTQPPGVGVGGYIEFEPQMRMASCTGVNFDASRFWRAAFRDLKANGAALLQPLRQERETLRKYKESRPDGAGSPTSVAELERSLRELDDLAALLKLPSYEKYQAYLSASAFDSPLLLNGVMPVDLGLGTMRSGRLGSRYGASSFFRLIDRKVILSPAVLAAAAGSIIDKTLMEMFPLGPFRRPPARWYVYTGTTPRSVGSQGQLLPDILYRSPKLLIEANEWLAKLDIGYQLTIAKLGGQQSELFEVRLVDTRRTRPTSIGLADVGFGISQVLPLLVQSLLGRGQTITVEQPEVHIHPKLQADLGDLLAHAIGDPNRNQFLIETHSEHLALRLQKLVRDKVLKPTDVSIVYVQRSPEGSTVQPIRIDEDGDFIDEFPGGFFPERLREL